ncbi:MAG: efflux RND transporter periplasmic adaptor subunit [Lewinellaceae bacterium]|nr:efflux RND transporter periplasmic adaptor subunit [Lewinellaceae bacterium]
MASIKKKKKGNWWIWVLIGAVALLIVAAVVSNRNKPNGERVFVEKAERRTIQETVSASGKVFPEVEVKISSDVSGEVVELFVEEGDSVVSGQLLARIDPDSYESQVERGVASLNASKASMSNAISNVDAVKAQSKQIEAQLINARDIHKRNEQLKKDGVISDADFESSLANVRALEANLAAAQANIRSAEESAKGAKFSVESSEAGLKELRTSLRRTTIYAPTSGIISQLNIEQGERVVGTIQMAGTEMMRLANLEVMEVRVDVSENDIPRVTLGDEAEIEVDAYVGRKFKGHVTQIAHSATSLGTSTSLTTDQVTNFEVRIRVDPASYTDLVTAKKRYPFRPGMSASVDIKTEVEENVVSVPIQAVTTREKNPGKKVRQVAMKDGQSGDSEEEEAKRIEDLMEVVFVAMPGDTVDMKEVKTGIQDDTYIVITSGLEEGAEVITGPYTAISRKLERGKKIEKSTEDKFYGTKDKE